MWINAKGAKVLDAVTGKGTLDCLEKLHVGQ